MTTRSARSRRRRTTYATTTAVLALLAVGCAREPRFDVDPSPYCDSYAGARAAFEQMGAGDIGGLGRAFGVLHDLARLSPREISAEWTVLDSALEAIERRVEAAGLDVGQLDAAVSEGVLPEGVDVVELQRLREDLGRLGTAELAAAADTIEQHGRDECRVFLAS